MARYVDKPIFDAAVAEMTEQRVRQSVARCFGWKPEAVRFLRHGVCFVKVRASFRCSVEFLVAEGFLVGVPAKKRWER